MNTNTASQFMDKQIMDLSNSQSTATAMNSGSSSHDFIDFMNRPSEKRDDIVPSYDFLPIRSGVGSSSPLPTMDHVSTFDSGEEDTAVRTWNSLDSKINVTSIRNHSSLDIDEPAKFVLGKNNTPLDASFNMSLVSEIDKTVKKYTDDLMHAMDGVSARLSQLETRTRNLEHSMDDLKESVGNNHGVIDGKLRQMGNILAEVRTGIQVVSDKQERIGELKAAKLQSPNLEHVASQTLAHTELTQSVASANQQFSTVSLTQPPPTLPPPNAPPPPSHQQNSQPQAQIPNQYSQDQATSVPQQESYFPPSVQTAEQQYQVPPPPSQHQHQHQPPPPQYQHQPPPPQNQHQPPPPQNQHQPLPLPQYSQPPQTSHQHQPLPPPQPHSQPPPPSQLHPPFSAINPSLPQPPLAHRSEEILYGPTQTYPPGIHPPPSHPPVGAPPPQQFYSPTPNVYEPQSSRPIPGYSNSYGQPAGHVEPYPYSSSSSQYGGDSPRKPQQLSSNSGGLSGGSGYPQLPTARILPQAIPTASSVSGGSGSGSSGNKVPIDDVVDKVTHMGFPRDQVRATVRKLTENGQSVDLNVVLDKLMNDSEGQAPQGWFGR